MDRNDTSLNETFALAVIRAPADVPRNDSRYGGTIMVNFGGPGSSGVGLLRWASYMMQSEIAGPKYFDLVSWDPRGIGATTPLPQCFDTDLQRQQYWIKQEVIGGIKTSPFSLQFGLVAADAFGKACNGTQIRYMTTLAAVQDMIAIADALEPNVTEPLINYWGISYGTFLGNTFASVYPHRIGKTVLDATLGSKDYLSSAWRTGLVNNSAIIEYFYDSTDAIRGNVENLLERLASHPLPIDSAPTHPADVLTDQPVRTLLFQDTYFPPVRFPSLALTLHGLMQDPPNTTLAAESIFTLSNPDIPLPAEIIKPSNYSWSNPLVTPPLINNYDSAHIIACTDGNPINNWTTADTQNCRSELTAISPIGAYTWPSTTTTCTRWPTSKRPPEHMRFTGPFGSSLSSYSTYQGARPILFVSNRADAVCPLTEAKEESAKHEGSVILETDIYGHSSLFNPNTCVWSHLRTYWNSGQLPDEGTVCPRDPWAWDPTPAGIS